VRTENHPLAYGGFEGTIPKGQYGGGTVMLWDTGTWEPLRDPRQGLAAGELKFLLHGKRLHGRWVLVRMRPREREKHEDWLLIKEQDEFAGAAPDLVERATTSVISGRSMPEIATGGAPKKTKPRREKRALPGFVPPALATLTGAAPSGAGWLFEVKYDGYRAIIAANGADVRIHTRTGRDWTARYPAIAEAIAALNLQATVLDGEITVIDRRGVTDFGALVAALEGTRPAPLSCFLFDVLRHKGKDCSSQPLTRRRAQLQRLLRTPGPDSPLQFSEVFTGDPAALLATACTHGLEGLIAKRADAPYRSGRHMDWLKIKCAHGQEFVIIGFAPSTRRPFASLLMGVREQGGLRYAGRVGTGFADAVLQNLTKWRDAHRQAHPACVVPPEWRRGVVWVKPQLVAEVGFAGWTPDGLIRHGRFTGLREDKPEQEVLREMPKAAAALHITHPDKMLYPGAGLTKADLATYVARAAPFMWPYIKNRFTSLVRCPEGAGQACFFQRHLSAGFTGWEAQDCTGSGGKTERYIYPTSQDALLTAVQMGVIEFHLWGARRDRPALPDRMVFDLDPGPDVPFAQVRSAAERLRDVLDALGLASQPMLSGGKGIHLVIPLRRKHEFAVIKRFSGDVARRLAADAPQRFTATMSKAERHGRIFIDYFRNDAGSTAVAPYSPRARAAAGVAWPCRWDELAGFECADAMTIPRAMQALETASDPWDGTPPQTLSAAALRAVAED
jgi:bifunctional non-homologous end joining protein LigD